MIARTHETKISGQPIVGLAMRLLSALVLLASLGLMITCASGCKAEAAPDAGYTDKTAMAKDPLIPFHKVWRKPGVDWSGYKKIYIAPVNTQYMLSITGWDAGVRKDEIEKDVAELATYTRDRLRKDFKEDPAHRYIVLDTPSKDRDVLEFEFAIVEVVPSKVVLNALGWVPFGVGMTLNAVRFIAKDQSCVSFEARGRDGATREIVFTAADRESQQSTIIDTRDLTWYSHARGIIDDWSKQFVAIANRKQGEKVEDTSAFRLKPW